MTASRRRWSFSLRTLFIGVTLLAPVGWVLHIRQQIADRTARLGAEGWSPLIGSFRQPKWQRWLFGEDLPRYTTHMWISRLSPPSDEAAAQLLSLEQTEFVGMNEKHITDAVLRHLRECESFKF